MDILMAEEAHKVQAKKPGYIIKAAIYSIVIALGLFIFLNNNTKWFRPDYSQPHQYIKIESFDSQWRSLKNEEASASVAIFKFMAHHNDNFFPVKKNECNSHLNSWSDKRIKDGITTFNFMIAEHYPQNSRVKHLKLYCVEYLGNDKNCEKKIIDESSANWKTKNREGRQAAMMRNLSSIIICRKERNIGQSKTISIN